MSLVFKKFKGYFFSILLVLNSCTTLPPTPISVGEQKSSFSYIPLDPLPVISEFPIDCDPSKIKSSSILASLPDQAVRIAIGQYDDSGTLQFGPVKVGTQGNSYQIILDYINVDATNIPVIVERTAIKPGASRYNVSVYEVAPVRETQYRVYRDPDSPLFKSQIAKPKYSNGEKVIIPVYFGVGLRLTASITVRKGNVNLSSLGSIAANAEAGNLTGSLIVQTLGITGRSISTSLPLPSELNQTTVQNAILALGSIKAILYDKENTTVTPRVVGIYNPIGGGQPVVNGIISLLASEPVIWRRLCN